jgi:hypothetical protein
MKNKIKVQRATNDMFVVTEIDKQPRIYNSITELALNEFMGDEVFNLLTDKLNMDNIEIDIFIKTNT